MRIRQGNDFIFLWAIERNGLPENLSNAVNIRLHFKNYDCVGNVQSFQIVDGNIVRVEVAPKWASRLGAYRLILSYEFEDQSYSDGDRKCVVDVLAFNIVPKTSEADDLTEMAKTTDIMIGLSGLSAYEVWLKDNPDKTKEDYYNWLQEPATDIAETVGLQEQARVEAEELRVLAEQDRQTSTQEAISDAEDATENANTAAQNADDARLAIQDDLALKADQADLVQLAGDVSLLEEISSDTLQILTGNDKITYNPSEQELLGGARSAHGSIGLLIRDTDISFDKIYHSIIGQDFDAMIKLDIYKVDTIQSSNIDFGTPIYTQIFKALYTSNPWQVTELNSVITADGKYIVLVFTNQDTSRLVSSFRFSNVPTPADGIWAVPYFKSSSSPDWVKNSDNYRFSCPRLILSNKLVTIDKIDDKWELHNNLYSEKSRNNVEVMSGNYGEENATYKILPTGRSEQKGYIGFEFKMNENIHTSVGEKEIARMDDLYGNSVRLFIKTEPISPFKKKQIIFQYPTDTTPDWNFESEYPIPFYNAYFICKSTINGSTQELVWQKRNPREWKPLVGEDAFSLQYKPQVIKTGGKIYDNQTLYETNKNWYLNVMTDRVQIVNEDLSKNITFLFSTYPYVNQLFAAIKNETNEGGQLEDFAFEQLNTGIVSGGSKNARPCTDLLPCTLKMVDKYPYQGTNSPVSKVAYDGWKAVVPYWKDESWHSFEIASVDGNHAYATIDGKPNTTGRLALAGRVLDSTTTTLGVEGGLKTTFKNFELYAGSTGNYHVFKEDLTQTFIASKKNPRIVGIMWHDVIPSDVVSRPTTWADVPKYMRVAFDQVVNATYVGGAVIYYRDYGQFTSEPELISGNIYEVDTIDGLRIRGTGTIVGGVVTQIKATDIVSGVWSERTYTNRFEGVIIRVGDNVCASTGFLNQCFELAEKNGYKMMKWADVAKVLRGESNEYLKVWAPQFDDYSIYLYTNNDIRKIFDRRGLPISVALDLTAVVDRLTGEANELAIETCNFMRMYGHETVIHNHWYYPTSFVSNILSDEAEIAIREAMEKAREFGTETTIWDQSQNLSTPNSQKLMESLGIELCISTLETSTTRATYKMYASRATLNPINAPSERPLF